MLQLPAIKASVNESPITDCWRMVWTGSTVIRLFESKGMTKTINSLFCSSVGGAGGKTECVAFATANNLVIPDDVLNPKNGVIAPLTLKKQRETT